MSAAGESGLCIVIATCAGGSAHRRAGGRDRHFATASLGAGRRYQRPPTPRALGCEGRTAPRACRVCEERRTMSHARRLSHLSGAVEPWRSFSRRGAGPVGRCPVLQKNSRQARGRMSDTDAAGKNLRAGRARSPLGGGAAGEFGNVRTRRKETDPTRTLPHRSDCCLYLPSGPSPTTTTTSFIPRSGESDIS
jgi:hypothetical protein